MGPQSTPKSIPPSPLLASYVSRGLQITHGDGMYLYGIDKTPYLDLMGNYGAIILGNSNPVISAKLIEQLHRVIALHGSFGSQIRTKVAFKVAEKSAMPQSAVFFSNSGTESVEAALKFAILATKKHVFISCSGSYHGKTIGALSVTSGDKYKQPFGPMLAQTRQVVFNDLTSLESAFSADIAGFIVEPIQGEAGIIPATHEFLEGAKQLCEAHGALFIADEIQCGCGRSGTFTAIEQMGIIPDILCLGKGIAGGLPVGITVVSHEISQHIPKTIHTTTFGGNPLVCAGIVATLELLTPELLHHVTEMGTYLHTQLASLHDPRMVSVQGRGLMIGIRMTIDPSPILKKLQEQHILAIPAYSNTIRLLPPYIIEKKHADEFVSSFSEILSCSS